MGVSAVRLQDKDTGKKLSVIESCECPGKYGVVLVNPDGSRIKGPKGDPGPQGCPGPTGPYICSAEFNDNDIDFGRSDGCTVKLEDAKICLQGPQGNPGPTGNGICCTQLNPDYTLTLQYTNGCSDTTESIRGCQGEQGNTGNGICCTTCSKVGKTTTVTLNYTNNTCFCFNVCDGQDGQGSGDVLGPNSSVDGHLVAFDGNSGKCIKDGGKIPSEACDVGALPDSTKYGSSLYVNMDSCTYQITYGLRDQDGNTLGVDCCIDLPIESVVVSGCYDSVCKEVELDLEGGSCIRFSVADLVSGLQSEITCSNKLSSDLVDDDGHTNKFVTSTEKSCWNGKAEVCDIPTNNCQLGNGCGYLKSCDLGGYAQCCDIPTDNCQLSNGCGYTKCTGNVSTCADIINRLGYTPYNSSNPSGYTNCTGTLVPSDLNGYAKSCDLCAVATSGKYCDLSGRVTDNCQIDNSCGYIKGINCGDVTSALGYTPYDSSNPSGYTNCSGDVQYCSFNINTVSSGATLTITNLTTQFTPNQNFSIVAGTVKEGMQYIVRINSGATAYTMSLGTGISNPFGEDLTLTASKTTTIILLAVSSSSLELFGIRTEE